jgi:hypothetical protein
MLRRRPGDKVEANEIENTLRVSVPAPTGFGCRAAGQPAGCGARDGTVHPQNQASAAQGSPPWQETTAWCPPRICAGG